MLILMPLIHINTINHINDIVRTHVIDKAYTTIVKNADDIPKLRLTLTSMLRLALALLLMINLFVSTDNTIDISAHVSIQVIIKVSIIVNANIDVEAKLESLFIHAR